MNIRELIYETLYELETTERKSHLIIREVLDSHDYLDMRDKALFKRITEGTVAKRCTLDFIADKYLSKPISKCKPGVRVIVRMSIYQLYFMDKIPDSAVINEAVKLIGKYSRPEFSGFVNATLRNIAANKESLEDLTKNLDKIERLSVLYSVPDWIVRMFVKEQKDPESLLKAIDTISDTTVTITDIDSKDEILSAWDASGVKYTESPYLPNTFRVSNFEGAQSLKGFFEGKLIIRDESSMLAALATGADSYENPTILDMCAAPGGKTATVADMLKGRGQIYSFDVSELKVNLIKENLERLNLTNVEARVNDATIYNEEYKDIADIVILDVPCSGLGVMGRKSDIRYNISNEIMRDLSVLQKDIVNTAVNYLKPGGVLVYSTCTIHKAENEKMVKYILDNFDFEPDSLKDVLPMLYKVDRDSDYMLQLRPDTDKTDGFFIARLRKKKNQV